MEKKVSWLELFYDLLFVAAIAKVTEVLLEVEDGRVSGELFLRFVLIFIPIWWSWVGQTLFINRYGKDFVHQKLIVLFSMVFVAIMSVSLNVDFDRYYPSFLLGYAGIRLFTACQYLLASRSETGERQKVAQFLGRFFLIGVGISLTSVFADGLLRYVLLYLGILFDILLPIFGRKKLKAVPVSQDHLFERFGLFTIILLGEALMNILSLFQKDADSQGLSVALAFSIIMVIWWQYFANLDYNLVKEKSRAGQVLLYGHLFIFMSLSLIISALYLIIEGALDYHFSVVYLFVVTAFYILATWIVFRSYQEAGKGTTFKELLAILIGGFLFASYDFLRPVAASSMLIQVFLIFVAYAFANQSTVKTIKKKQLSKR